MECGESDSNADQQKRAGVFLKALIEINLCIETDHKFTCQHKVQAENISINLNTLER